MLRLYKALPTLHGLVRSSLQIETVKNISCSATNRKKFSFSDLDPDTQVILVSPKDASENQMKYSEVLEKVALSPNLPSKSKVTFFFKIIEMFDCFRSGTGNS